MRTRVGLFVGGLLLGVVVGTQTEPLESGQASQKTDITGVWGFMSEKNGGTGEVRDESALSGIWVFTNRYHCVARMQNGRNGLTREELSKLPLTDQVKHYEQLLRYVSNAGPYSVEGETLRRTWQISSDPGMLGQESIGKYSVKGDRLFVDLPPRSGGTGSSVVYRRLE